MDSCSASRVAVAAMIGPGCKVESWRIGTQDHTSIREGMSCYCHDCHSRLALGEVNGLLKLETLTAGDVMRNDPSMPGLGVSW